MLRLALSPVWEKLFPDGLACLLCGGPVEEASQLCAACYEKMYIYEGPGHAVWEYFEAAADAVRRLKFNDNTALARPMGVAMAGLARDHGIVADIIVPVPLHWRRQWMRGYNQSALLGGVMAYYLGIPLCKKALKRVRYTSSQMSLAREQRLVNLRGAFAARGELVRGKRVLLVDDVATTGATLHECKKTLIEAGCVRVITLTACRVS